MPEIRFIRKDGSAVGEEDGKLFLGDPIEVPFDELEIYVRVEDYTIYKVIGYNGTVIAREKLVKDSFVADIDNLFPHLEGAGEAAWEAAKEPTPYQKAYYDMPPGFDRVEKTQTVYVWKEIG